MIRPRAGVFHVVDLPLLTIQTRHLVAIEIGDTVTQRQQSGAAVPAERRGTDAALCHCRCLKPQRDSPTAENGFRLILTL